MPPVRGRRTLLYLLPLAALVAAVGCAPRLELQSAPRLEPLLPESDAYPEGFSFERLDLDALNEMSVSAAHPFEASGLSRCEEAVNRATRPFPEGPAGVTGQRALSRTEPPAIYSYALVLGEAPEEWADASEGVSLDSCSNARVALDETEMSGGVTVEDSPALPENGRMISATLSDAGAELFVRSAWGRVGNVHFTLMYTEPNDDPSSSSSSLSYDVIEACSDSNPGSSEWSDCYDQQVLERADQDRQQTADEFDAVLTAAMDALADSA
ncbi:hypothetical protein [Nocardiopsis lucentensis]|uniref:hypothetical protein n=1 Tax=Nocardiopsis lucentensis TaxID=53441 RepID=UPI0003470C86|nr:hypothetical protein [Nocardiopsis lucentensis]